ncbi:hypothetical protein [Streptomyces sp. NBC_00459]|uniref:hypothetical protein n=1 Tax=Streptomyces sp. NBC_00459 TaxID=2975749 RepID=UPI002E19A58E
MTQRPVLVVGNTSTRVALEDLTAFAFDVADHLGLPAQVADGRDYAVTDFEAVVLCDTWMDSVSSVVLGVEARQADLCVLTADEVYDYPRSASCFHCFTADSEAAPYLVGDVWSPAVCSPCVAEAERVAATRPVAVTV